MFYSVHTNYTVCCNICQFELTLLKGRRAGRSRQQHHTESDHQQYQCRPPLTGVKDLPLVGFCSTMRAVKTNGRGCIGGWFPPSLE